MLFLFQNCKEPVSLIAHFKNLLCYGVGEKLMQEERKGGKKKKNSNIENYNFVIQILTNFYIETSRKSKKVDILIGDKVKCG